ncbi:MAG: hypothetical protein N2Z76_06630 [Treponemataceae bacterium]|nr:hypothetical protein [Treponemataceae bacterium]
MSITNFLGFLFLFTIILFLPEIITYYKYRKCFIFAGQLIGYPIAIIIAMICYFLLEEQDKVLFVVASFLNVILITLINFKERIKKQEEKLTAEGVDTKSEKKEE